MGQYNNSTKTLSLAAGATGRLWAAPSGMPFKNVTVSVHTEAHMPVNQVTYQVFFGGYFTVAAAYTSGATHNGGTSQGAAAALTGDGAAITAFADAGDATHVIVTSNGHALLDGETVSISGTTNYNGVFTVSSSLVNTFEIVDTWVANDATGTWAQYMSSAQLIFEDTSSFPINSPSAPANQSTGGFPIAVQFVNGSQAAMVLKVTFACETIGTNV